MYFDPYQVQRLAEERMKDALREGEHKRLARTANNRRKARGRWWASLTLPFSNLAGIAIQPQGLGGGQAAYRRRRRNEL